MITYETYKKEFSFENHVLEVKQRLRPIEETAKFQKIVLKTQFYKKISIEVKYSTKLFIKLKFFIKI